MNNLPKSWGVYFEKKPGRKNPVILYLNSLKKLSYDLSGDSKAYYGVSHTDNVTCTDEKFSFETILTEQKFIELSQGLTINNVIETVYCVVEMMDCELLGVRTGTKEESTELFKTLIKENDENMTDGFIDLCLIRGNFESSDGYKIHLLESKKITQK